MTGSGLGHGTTQATNALIERKGAVLGLITTRGFADTLRIQRLMGFTAGVPGERPGWYSKRRHPDPVVPPRFVLEVSERIDHAGAILVPLDERAARRAVAELLDAGVEAIAVAFLWSFRNPAHEQRVGEIVREVAGDRVFVSLSSRVNPVIGEYERTATTVLNGYLGPIVEQYIERLEVKLREHGFRGAFRILDSNGGVMNAVDAAARAVLLLSSGPTGGVLGPRYLAQALGHRDVITTDMGARASTSDRSSEDARCCATSRRSAATTSAPRWCRSMPSEQEEACVWRGRSRSLLLVRGRARSRADRDPRDLHGAVGLRRARLRPVEAGRRSVWRSPRTRRRS